MSAPELKSNIHKIVESIESEQLLQSVYDFLKSREKTSRIWDSLTTEQQQEVMLAYEESEDESNLIDRDQFFKSK
ncbi:MAG: hypothetical protein J0L67_13525 [Cytophagales bacterium]|nr:hypothetical protein [Cytophagales bacterium]